MSGENSRLTERMRKLAELAKRGQGAEQEVARSILEALSEKYGIELAEVEEESRQSRAFAYRNSLERRLLLQILRATLPGDAKIWRLHGKAKYAVDVTDREYAEVDVQYNAYRKAMKADLETFIVAFVHRHDIFPPSSAEDAPREAPDPEEVTRVFQMAKAMRDVSVRPALEAGV